MAVEEIELFQSFCTKYFNRVIREHFKDLDNIDEGELDIDAPRQLMKRILLHKDNDPFSLTTARLVIWYFEAKGIFEEPFYGIPATNFYENYSFKPQLVLHFREKQYAAQTNNRKPARAQVAIRIRDEDFTTTAINSLINKIYSLFVTPVFHYKKGRVIFSYIDKRKGYNFLIRANSESEAKKIIQQAYEIQDTGVPDWNEFLRDSNSRKNYNTIENITVMGKTTKKPKRRPIAEVYFAYAEFFIPGLNQPLVLIDRTGTKATALRIA